MNRKWRIAAVLVFVTLFAGWCASRSASGQERAKPRSDKKERQKDHGRTREQGAERRHPRPAPHEARPQRPNSHNRYYRFEHRHYRGNRFGPHYRLWYYDRFDAWQLFYWPYPYEPRLGCSWYRVPTERRLVYDHYSRREYREYSRYRRLYLCFD